VGGAAALASGHAASPAERATPLGWLGAACIAALLAAAVVGAVRWPEAARADDHEDPIAALIAAERRLAEAGQGGAEASRATLRSIAGRHPRDGRAWMLLAFAELKAERHAEGAAAIEQAIKVSRRVAADPAAWCEWADALGMAQGGTLAGRPTELIDKALQLNASHPKALEMAGSAAYERRDFKLAATYWAKLLALMHAGTRQHAELSAAIERAKRLSATSLP
jgi:cytochrome c-type biogenesis protein CcmH